MPTVRQWTDVCDSIDATTDIASRSASQWAKDCISPYPDPMIEDKRIGEDERQGPSSSDTDTASADDHPTTGRHDNRFHHPT
ncbi:hypothetical protein ANO14919_039690 [Xylariales sp. No.14919]|nr:hypothetical protein ANO14919_039690 [Xylariales sp. No.14919]